MYKFTNGIVVYDEETKNRYIKAGMTLVEEPKPVVKEEKEVVKENLQSEPKQNEFRQTRKRTERFSRSHR